MKNEIKKLYYSIGEVSKMVDLKSYVLRYWETEFKQLSPAKNRAGNRTYRQKDIDLIFKIKDLLSNEIKLREIASSLNLKDDYDIGKIIDKIFSLKIEPNLVQPTFVLDYPKVLSPLSKIKRDQDDDIVERFELFIGGIEIANAFSELNDPIDQRERFSAQEKLKDKGDEEAQVLDENFLEAIESGMPPTGGVGIGIDRVVMILTGNTSIKDVILFPAMRNITS